MLTAILIMAGLAVALGLILGYAALKFRVEGNPLTEKAAAILPNTQCGQCGYAGCAPYAQAVAEGKAATNLCVPGGDPVAKGLAELLGVEFQPVNYGEGQAAGPKPKQVAFIDENLCIGCTACLKACPQDAILGASKMMHTVIAQYCTGCELCVAPCPVDCISMIPVGADIASWKWKYPVYQIKKAA
ncbi:MAG: electron transport complex subunit RsxB [Sulfuricella sp.]|nr:electron transport complex subunit RsxB [Sulfuricella sp.]